MAIDHHNLRVLACYELMMFGTFEMRKVFAYLQTSELIKRTYSLKIR